MDIAEGFDNLDALTTISILTWLDDPRILRHSILSLDLCDGLLIVRGHFFVVVVVVVARSLGGSLWLLSVILFYCSLDLLLRILDPFLESIVVVLELVEFVVIHPVLGVERHRKHLKRVLAQ